jgi:aldehyde dehydrogenase (NAD+)
VATWNFAPVLYLLKYSGTVEDAIAIQNGVAQDCLLQSWLINLREAELFFYLLLVQIVDCQRTLNIRVKSVVLFEEKRAMGGGRESGLMHGKYTWEDKPILSTILQAYLCHKE